MSDTETLKEDDKKHYNDLQFVLSRPDLLVITGVLRHLSCFSYFLYICLKVSLCPLIFSGIFENKLSQTISDKTIRKHFC